MPPRLLVISESFPYPPTSGDVMPIHYILRTMAQESRMRLLTIPPREADVAAAGLAIFKSWGIDVETAEPPRGRGWRQALACLRAGRPWINRFFSPDLARRTAAALREGGWDCLVTWSIGSAQHAPARPGIPSILYARDCLSLNHYRHYEKNHSIREYLQFLKIRWMEKSLYAQADLVLGVTEGDTAEMRKLARGPRYGVLPTGVNLDLFQPRPELREADTVVFSGAMDYRPNGDAAEWMGREIWPRVRARMPGARLLLVGRQPTPAMLALAQADPSIVVTGLVDKFEAWVARATVFASPLRTGTGMKNKVLESAAMGIPMIVSPVSLEGIAMEPGRDLLLAEQPEEWAEKIVQLLGDAALREKLAANAVIAVQQYSMAAMARRLVQHAGQLAEERKQGAA